MSTAQDSDSLCDVAASIAAGEVSSEEVTGTAITRAQGLQPQLNTFISLRAEQAMEAARRIDQRIARGETCPPLAGVPLAHKDMFYRAGMGTSCGSAIRRDFVADDTATVLSRLDAAGAIDLGGLNMSEFAVGPFGTNVHFGTCRNPWDTHRSAGGSSSGSGASVASRLVFGALGSDTGGSVRIPSALCGVAGMKPSQGRVSRHGMMPLSFSFDTTGPLARTVRDVARLMDVIAGHDPLDATSSKQPAGDCESACGRDVQSLRLGIPTSYYFDELTPPVAQAVEAAQHALAGLGVDVRPVPVPAHDTMNLVWAAALGAEAATIHRKWLRERPQDYGPMVRRRIEFGLYQPATRYIEALSMRGQLLAEFCASAFAECDVLLTPTAPMTAPALADIDVGDSAKMPELVLLASRCTRPISYLGLPALSVPCGFDEDGLPIAFQLVGRPFAEAQLCQLGDAYQQVTNWHTARPSCAGDQ